MTSGDLCSDRHVDDIDLFPGGLAEKPVIRGLVGPTFACILGQQFLNLRRGTSHTNPRTSTTPPKPHSLFTCVCMSTTNPYKPFTTSPLCVCVCKSITNPFNPTPTSHITFMYTSSTHPNPTPHTHLSVYSACYTQPYISCVLTIKQKHRTFISAHFKLGC